MVVRRTFAEIGKKLLHDELHIDGICHTEQQVQLDMHCIGVCHVMYCIALQSIKLCCGMSRYVI